MGPGRRLDAGTAQIYALDLRVLSNLEAKWFEDMRNSPRRAGPSFHPYMLYMLSLCCKRLKIQIRSAQNVGKVWISGKILVAPFGSFHVKFEINHTTLNSFPIPKCDRQCSDSQMGRVWDVLLVDSWVWLIIRNIQGEHYDLLSS